MQLLFQILRKISFKKLTNILFVYVSYLLSIIFKTKKRFGFPVSISIEPTSVCNLKCPECPTGLDELTRYKGHIDFNIYKKAIDELSPYLVSLILYFQGEPFLNKDIFNLIEYSAKTKNIFTITSTNGHFLDIETSKKIINSGLDKLIISVDGTSQEVYERYRKTGNLNTVIQGVRNIISAKKELKSKTPFIVIQFLVFKFNEHQISEIKKLSKDLQVDKLELKSAQIYDFKNDNNFIPSNKKYSRYKKNEQGVY
ncbi:MAG: radical SAM protein, partial [Chlorobi bacterium]|nr:radical SAM protein [Chlorobiota bacterium]